MWWLACAVPDSEPGKESPPPDTGGETGGPDTATSVVDSWAIECPEETAVPDPPYTEAIEANGENATWPSASAVVSAGSAEHCGSGCVGYANCVGQGASGPVIYTVGSYGEPESIVTAFDALGGFQTFEDHVAIWYADEETDQWSDLACVGDLTGDGVDEFVVGHTMVWDVFPHDAVLAIHDGAAGGGVIDEGRTVLLRPPNGWLTATGLAADDLDGDGVDEVLTTVGGATTDDESIAYVVGISPDLVGDLRLEDVSLLVSPPSIEPYGGRLGIPAGDVNGDGHEDLLGMITEGNTAFYPTRGFHVLLGPLSGERSWDEAEVLVTDPEETGWRDIGDLLAAGDLDNDGRSEVVAVAGRGDEDLPATHLLVFDDLGPGALTVADSSLLVPLFSACLEPPHLLELDLGDLDGDGFLDAIFTGYGSPFGWYPGGSYSVVAGPLTETSGEAAWVVGDVTDTVPATLGYTTDASTDIDGDGVADLLFGSDVYLSAEVAARGAIYTFLSGDDYLQPWPG